MEMNDHARLETGQEAEEKPIHVARRLRAVRAVIKQKVAGFKRVEDVERGLLQHDAVNLPLRGKMLEEVWIGVRLDEGDLGRGACVVIAVHRLFQEQARPTATDLHVAARFARTDQPVLGDGVGVVPKVVVPGEVGTVERRKVGNAAQLRGESADFARYFELRFEAPVDFGGIGIVTPEAGMFFQEIAIVER